jgi:hypothetical protein
MNNRKIELIQVRYKDAVILSFAMNEVHVYCPASGKFSEFDSRRKTTQWDVCGALQDRDTFVSRTGLASIDDKLNFYWVRASPE